MSIRTAALTLTVLAFGLTGQCRELRAEAPAEAEEPCTPSWSATLDATLANTISSSAMGAGRVTLTLIDEETLYFTTTLKEGIKVKSLELQVRDSRNQISVLDLPLATQMSNETEGFVSSNATNFETVISTLRDGWSVVVAEVASPLHTSLAGALTSDCDDELTTEIVVDWQSGDSLPACNMPGFTELYMIPDGCFAFPDGLMESCALSMEDVLVASSRDASGNLIGYGVSAAACLPTGCDPCSKSQDTEEQLAQQEAAMVRYRSPQDTQCLQPGFESFYQVPGSCDNLADRLQDFCGVTAEQVMQASAGALFSMDGICLPDGCEPCSPYPLEAPPRLDQAAPFCGINYMYTKAYNIPAGCGYFPDALKSSCGLEGEVVAEASGMAAYPAFAGFGQGKTVCLPEICDPCGKSVQYLVSAA